MNTASVNIGELVSSVDTWFFFFSWVNTSSRLA